MSKEQIEEMKTVLNNYFDTTPMELSFKHENGDTDIITDEKALGVLDAITRQALIPVFCEALYNAGYLKQEWISVEERLPDEQAKYLIVDDEGYMEVALWTRQFGWFSHVNRGNKVTHWMPLPEPPKGGEG